MHFHSHFLFIFLDSETTKSPALTPYPDWQTIVNSPTAIKADRCKNLWVVDDIKAGGYILLRFNLTSDVLSERYPVPRELIKPNSNITSIAIEDEDCENLYVYMADSGASKLIVSQIKGNQTWAVNHHFFSTDPVSGNFSVGGIKYQTTDGITGLWLSEKKSNGFADLYFHPLSSNNEFKISTKLLHDNKTLPAYSDLELIGNRGQDRQAGASAYSQKAGVVFYAMVNKNQLSCWRLSNTAKYADAVVNVHNDSIEMIYPSDIKVSGGDVYVLTNNLPAFVHDEIKGDKINYRIFKSSVSDAISDTDCKKSIKDHINSAVDKITNFVPGNKDTTKPNNSNSLQPMTTIIFGAILFALIKFRNF